MVEQPTRMKFWPHPGLEHDDAFERQPANMRPLIDFRFVVSILRRRMKLIALVLLASVAVAAAIVFLTPPTYSATTSLILEKPTVDPLQRESVSASPSLTPYDADTQVQIIGSKAIIGEVVGDLDLLHDPAFTEPPRGLPQKASLWLTDHLSRLDLGHYLTWLDSKMPQLFTRQPPLSGEQQTQSAIRKIQKSLHVRRSGPTYVFKISVHWPNPDMAARLANAVAHTYIADRNQQHAGDLAKASAWFEGRLSELKKKATDAEAAVATFRADNNIVDAGRGGLLNEQQLAAVAAELAKAQSDARTAEDRANRLASVSLDNIATAPIGDSADESALSGMRTRLVTLRQQEQNAASQFGDNQIITVNLGTQVRQIEASIRAEIQRLQAASQAAYRAAAAHARQLQTQLDSLSQQATAVDGAQGKLNALQGEAAVYRQLYDSYLQRYMQTVQQQSLPSGDARVISDAVPPRVKDNMSSRTILALSLAVGMVFGLGAAFFRERMDGTVRSLSQLEVATGAAALGILPALDRKKRAEARRASASITPAPIEEGVSAAQRLNITDPRYTMLVSGPLSRYAETLRRTKSTMDAAGYSKPCFIGFISDEDREPRSVTAANYAQLLAANDRKTLLVDLDLRNAHLTRALAPHADVGLIDLMSPKREISPHLHVWSHNALPMHFLPARGAQASAAGEATLNSDQLAWVLKSLGSHYDHVVLDLPPLAVSSEAAILSQLVVGYVVVAVWGQTSLDALSRHLMHSGIRPGRILGNVISEVDMKAYRKYERSDAQA